MRSVMPRMSPVPSPFGVVEGLDVRAVEDGVLPPQVTGVAHPHAIAALGWGAVADSCGSTCSPNASMKPDCCLPTKCR